MRRTVIHLPVTVKAELQYIIRKLALPVLRALGVKYVRKKVNGDDVYLPVAGHPLNKLFLNKDYWIDHPERDFAAAIVTHLPKGACAVDVGGFLGYHTVQMARAVGAEGCIYTFEPNPTSYQALLATVRRNEFLRNVTLINAAVSNMAGKVFIDLQHDETGISPSGEGETSIEADCFTLEHFFAGRKDVPALIKIDVEGYEMHVLEGAERVLKKTSTVCVEIHPAKMRFATGHTEEELYAFMHEAGFEEAASFKSISGDSANGAPYNVIFVSRNTVDRAPDSP